MLEIKVTLNAKLDNRGFSEVFLSGEQLSNTYIIGIVNSNLDLLFLCNCQQVYNSYELKRCLYFHL